MRTQHSHQPKEDLGVVWFLVPTVWAAIGLAGFALIANWPELFAQEQPAASVAVTAPAHAGADRAVPQGGGMPTAGASTAREATQPVDQF